MSIGFSLVVDLYLVFVVSNSLSLLENGVGLTSQVFNISPRYIGVGGAGDPASFLTTGNSC